MKTLKYVPFTLTALATAFAYGGDLSKDGYGEYTYGSWDYPATGYWYSATSDWSCMSNNVAITDTFPRDGWFARVGNWYQSNCGIILRENESTPKFRGVNIAYGNGGGTYTMFMQTGSYMCVSTPNGNANYEGLRLGSYFNTYGKLIMDHAVLDSNFTVIGAYSKSGTNKPGRGYVYAGNDSIISNAYCAVGCSAEGTLVVDHSRYQGNKDEQVIVGANGTGLDFRSALTVTNQSYFTAGKLVIRGNADVLFDGSLYDEGFHNWSANGCTVTLAGDIDQTNAIKVAHSSFVQYRPECDRTEAGRFWARWCKTRFASKGYSEFILDNVAVTNCGVWFWPEENAGNVYPIKPPRYVLKGGELYIYNINNNGDSIKGFGQGVAAHGFAAAPNAPNAGTISLVDAPKVSYPRVCTNLLLSGMGQDASARVFGTTDYRPHFEFVLTKKGQRPMEIREQTDILGMYSFVPQGGLQVVQTNRFALIRHKTASKTLTTLDEPQFRAPNANLWTTGGFADVPCEWGITLKPTAEIALGADLGDGVACGYVNLPRYKPDAIRRALLRLKLAPQAKTLAEVAADLTAAGYPATLEGADVVVVDLLASGMLVKGRTNKVLLDFNAPQDAIAVRDNVKTAHALILGATVVYEGRGFTITVK